MNVSAYIPKRILGCDAERSRSRQIEALELQRQAKIDKMFNKPPEKGLRLLLPSSAGAVNKEYTWGSE
jgi:hypothetical protein